MWFIKGRLPSSIDFEAKVSSFGLGYERLEFWITVLTEISESSSSSEEVSLAIPFPWSSNKPNGSLVLLDSPENTIIYPDARKLKDRSLGYDHIDSNELWEFYNEEDYGIIVSPLKVGVKTHFEYTHKISTMSRLFVPVKLSNKHFMKKPDYNLKITTDNVLKYQNVKHLLNYEDGVYTLKDYYRHTESVDVWFATNNWDSSDDSDSSESSESDNEETKE